MNFKEELLRVKREIKMFFKYVSIAFAGSLSLTLLMKAFTYIGLSSKIAGTISAIGILFIPLAYAYYVLQIAITMFKGWRNENI